METFTLIITVIGAICFLCAVAYEFLPKHTGSNVGKVSEPSTDQADDAWWNESWWREIFDYWD